MNIEVSNNFDKISLISDNSNQNQNYPVLEISINNKLQFVQVVNGSTTIGGTTYNTSTGINDLSFDSTVTTIGTQYIHRITPSELNLNSLYNGVWSFKLIDANQVENIFLGTVVHDSIDCCIANKLDDLGACTNEYLDEVNRIYGLLYSSKISAKKTEFSNAICKYDIAKTMCKDCGCV